MGQRSDDLEAIPPLGDEPAWRDAPAASSRRRLSRRSQVLVVAVGVMLLAAVVGIPLRSQLARTELLSMDRQWALVLADDMTRFSSGQQLNAYVGVDPGVANPALAELFGEERGRLLVIRAQLHRAILVNHALSNLRSDLVSAIDHRAALLALAGRSSLTAAGQTPDADLQTAGDTLRVDREFAAEWASWGQLQPTTTATAPPYHGAVTALAVLRPWLSQRTGVVLLSGFGQGVARLDVDANRVAPTSLPLMPEDVTPRQGYLAYAYEGVIWAVAPDGSGLPRAFAPGDSMFAADDPSAVWVVRQGIVTEVDQTGKILVGPVESPGTVEAATSAGLVVALVGQPSLELWDPVTGTIRCPIVTNGQSFVMASQGNLLVWGSYDGMMHLTDVTTCGQRLARAIDLTQGFPQGSAVFSPDGRTLAVAASRKDATGTDTFPLELIDVTSGQETDVPIPDRLQGLITAVAWTADGTRLFWLSAGLSGNAPVIETWRRGDGNAEPLRLVGVALAPPLFSILP